MPESLKFRLSRREACLGMGAALAATACNGPQDAAPHTPERLPEGWTMGEALPYPIQEIYPCLHGDAIHLAGGFIGQNGQITGPTALHHAWRPDGLGWRPEAPLPEARHHPHLVSFAGHLWALAGYQSPSAQAVWEAQAGGWWLDEAGNVWRRAPELPRPCGEAVVLVAPSGGLHFIGGRSPEADTNANWNDQIDQTHHFVLAGPQDEWQLAAPCPTARNSAAGAEIAGNLHVVGGRSVVGGNTAAHEVYDPREDRWRVAAPMPQAQAGLAAAALDGRLYAFGGEFFENGGGVYPEAWIYDPARDAWEAIAPMPHPRHGLGAVALNGAIHVMGGALKMGGNETSALVELYRP